MAVVRVSAVASLVVSFNFLAAFFALKRWHGNSQQNTTANHNNFFLWDFVIFYQPEKNTEEENQADA